MRQVIQFNPQDITYIILSLAHKANLHIVFSWKRKLSSFLFLLGVFGFFYETFSLNMASSMFGIELEEMESLDEAKNVVGELCNMISGALKSDLCGAGLDCRGIVAVNISAMSLFHWAITPSYVESQGLDLTLARESHFWFKSNKLPF
jgi:hypothetical protein